MKTFIENKYWKTRLWQLINVSRYKFNVAPPGPEGQQNTHHPNSLHQSSERRSGEVGRESTCRAKAAARIPAISHNNPQQPLESTTPNHLGPNNQKQLQDFSELAANHSGYATSTGKLFESKAKGLHDSFKQFRQFRYDHQMDDEPEQVVFDAFDLQGGHY